MLRPVVAGVDESPESLVAAEWAAREALLRERPLRLVHAWNWSPHPSADLPLAVTAVGGGQRVRAQAALDAARARAHAASPTVPLTAELREGSAATVLLGAAEAAEVLVLGSRGLGAVRGAVVGSVALGVAGAASVPVVLVRAGTPRGSAPGTGHEDRATSPGPARPDVVLGLDLADPSDEVLEFAFGAAELRGTRLAVVSAWRSPARFTKGSGMPVFAEGPPREGEAHDFQEAVLRSWRDKYPHVEIVVTVVEGRAATPLLAAAEEASLVVVGRHVHEGHRPAHHNGPVAHAVMHHARCPVAVVPHP
ncbi:universal stress protein [Actinomycetota bacterium Odt1-20B]